ncbi:DUF6745 domain-containing protein, partial [Pseudonocardia lacus]|uniref:DUF6745 domain-containing protein n=1 Tax=Pseudonocardia lacus TaxID=2835865 RepID=UPI0038B43A13
AGARVRAGCLAALRTAGPGLLAAGPTAGERVSMLPRPRERPPGATRPPDVSRTLRPPRLWEGQVARRLRQEMRDPTDPTPGQDRLDPLLEQLYAAYNMWSLARALVSSRLCHELDGAPGRAADEPLAAAVAATGWLWPLRGAAVLTDRPTDLHLDHDQRLHRADGPALTWADGWTLHSWHGTNVPPDLVAGAGWDVGRILTEPNAEVRRCAIERMGWARFVAATGMAQVGADQPDPGNPGRVLRLYDLPDRLRDLYPRPARVLLVVNASPDRDGTHRAFGLPVPADVPDALGAAAATFGVSRAEYASLDRAT